MRRDPTRLPAHSKSVVAARCLRSGLRSSIVGNSTRAPFGQQTLRLKEYSHLQETGLLQRKESARAIQWCESVRGGDHVAEKRQPGWVDEHGTESDQHQDEDEEQCPDKQPERRRGSFRTSGPGLGSRSGPSGCVARRGDRRSICTYDGDLRSRHRSLRSVIGGGVARTRGGRSYAVGLFSHTEDCVVDGVIAS